MKATTKGVLATLHVLSWIIFVGLCIRTAAILFTFLVSIYSTPAGAKNLYPELNLSNLYDYDITYYIIITSMIIVITALKALIFYLVIRIFLKINYVNPFSKQIASLISSIGYISLIVGLTSKIVMGQCE